MSGAITFYESNQLIVDAYLAEAEKERDEFARDHPLPEELCKSLSAPVKRCCQTTVKIKFLADANLNRATVSGVVRVEPSIDFLTASAAQLEGAPGVILISKKTSVAEAIESLVLGWLASEPAEWVNRICRLPC